MKKLIILRHGEAENEARGSRDKDRELTGSGTRDVLLKGQWLTQQRLKPDFVVVSDSKRTTQTAELIAEKCEIPAEKFLYTDKLYNAPLGELMNIICELDSSIDTAMVVAHNPGVSYLSEYLTNEMVPFIPSGIATILFDVKSWQEVSKGTGNLTAVNNDVQLDEDM